MKVNTFENQFKHLINVPVKRFNSKGYSKKYGNLSVHDGEYDLDSFYYVCIDDEVVHVASPFIPFFDKEGKKNKYGIINGSFLIPITEDYLFDNGYIESYKRLQISKQEVKTSVEEYSQKLEEKYVEITERENKHNFKDITDSLASLLEYKNSKYGNSALEPLEIFAGKTKVGTRIDDKLARIKNSKTLRKNDISDFLGYLVLICRENNWTNFDELKD